MEKVAMLLIASLLLTGMFIPTIGVSYSPPRVTPMPCRHLCYIHILSKSEVGVVIQRSEVICFCTNAGFPSQRFYKVALIILRVHIYDGACSSFNIPSYIPNIIAALGTVLRR